MKTRNRKDYILIILGCIMLFFGVGYSTIYHNLEIVGFAQVIKDFKILITDVEFEEREKGKNSFLTYNEDTVTFNFILEDYSDAVEYFVKVENKGNIDAVLKSVVPEVSSDAEWLDYSLAILDDKKRDMGVVEGNILGSNEFHYVKLVMKLKDGTPIKPNKGIIKFKLDYVQDDYNK